MSAIFLKKELQKQHKFFIFLRGCYFVMGSPIDMNVGVFCETSVRTFLNDLDQIS